MPENVAIDFSQFPDSRGHFGPYGGQFVAETRMECIVYRDLEDVRHALRLDGKTKLLSCVATDRDTVKTVLLELLYSILKEMESGK